MEKILKQLGLDAKSTEDEAIDRIAELKKTIKDREALLRQCAEENERLADQLQVKNGQDASPREKQIAAKMAAGLTRETAIMAIEHQEAEDAARAKAKKGGSKK